MEPVAVSDLAVHQKQLRKRKIPEILAPAGNLRNVKAAIDYGADAVYCGGKEFGMRTAPKNLSLEDFAEATQYAHDRGARIYVTCNILPRNDEIAEMNRYFGHLQETGVDALIVTDIGVLMAARQIVPDLEIHISTQAGVTNYQAANALHQLGASRVVLARELDLESISQIRAKVSSELEIECFVHGSMCMAFSGRCLISSHTTGRDANHGDCAQSCRWKYHVMEEKRPGQFFPVEVTEQGTFLFNSQDMNMLEHVDDVLDAGVTSLKIEGRAKSTYYVAAITNAYRCAVNEYLVQRGFEDQAGNQLQPYNHRVDLSTGQIKPWEGKAFTLPDWLPEEPFKVTHRQYCTGFYYPQQSASEHIKSGGYINDWQIVGEVLRYDLKQQRLYLWAKNKIEPGREIEFLLPGQAPIKYQVPPQGLLDQAGQEVTAINNPAHEFSLPCPIMIPAGAMIRSESAAARRRKLLPVIEQNGPQ